MTILPPPPPRLEDLRYGVVLAAGLGKSTIVGDFDFETYSEAGYSWNPETMKFTSLPDTKGKGITVVGAAVYSEHATTEVLCLAYDLKDGKGRRSWHPGLLPTLPFDLFEFLAEGKLLEAWNCSFERWIWESVCIPKYGFPPLPFDQLRDAKAKALAYCLPPSLGNAAEALGTQQKKDIDGKRLINKYSIPKNPLKSQPDRRRTLLNWADPDTLNLFMYNLQDIVAEAELSSKIPDLSPAELDLWLCDQRINYRGIQVDIKAVESCITIIKKSYQRYSQEIQDLTNGVVKSATKLADIRKWLASRGTIVADLNNEAIEELFKRPLAPDIKRVLEIRLMVGSASVAKLFALRNKVSRDGRLKDMFVFHGARTGRYTAQGVQPQNFPNSGPIVYKCTCVNPTVYFGNMCGQCKTSASEWNAAAVGTALTDIGTEKLSYVIAQWGDPIALVSGCLRGLFIAKPGHDLVCSDYSAIEAVVLAALAGEEWRLEVFRTHGMIYETSASKITGIPFAEYVRHKKETGQHHPTRKTIGKVAELASGYGGGLGAWKQFGADEFFTDDLIKANVAAWRKASPMITKFWGGKNRNGYYGLEGAAVLALQNKNKEYGYRGINFLCQGDALYCRLLSGRTITYHRPRLELTKWGSLGITYEGWNTNIKNGPIHKWVRMHTYGGRLTENVVQATARDILAHAIKNLEKRGYPVVLHVHDEIVSEIPEGFGSLKEFENIMMDFPEWAKNWPLKASGGWRSKRYGK